MSSPRQIREEVTAKIVAALEKDLLPWRRPWVAKSGQHSNATTKKPYRGVNPLLLQIHSLEHGFSSNWWATFNQWKSLGCYVNRRPDDVEPGHWGANLAVYIPITTKEETKDEDDEQEEETYWILKRFTVFNANQVTGMAAEQYQAVELAATTMPDYEPAEELLLKSGAEIHFGGDQAFYRPPTPHGTWPNHSKGDFIQVPHKSSFVNGGYYATVLHEMGHWSEVRVGWDRGKDSYAMGELIAEMASCFLATELGIPNGEPLENHAAYLKSWLDAMKGDPNYIFKASRQASKVADFLLSFVRQPETQPTTELVEAA